MTTHFAFALLLLVASVLPRRAMAQEMARALDAVAQNWEPVHPAAYRVRLAAAADGRMGIGISLVIP